MCLGIGDKLYGQLMVSASANTEVAYVDRALPMRTCKDSFFPSRGVRDGCASFAELKQKENLSGPCELCNCPHAHFLCDC